MADPDDIPFEAQQPLVGAQVHVNRAVSAFNVRENRHRFSPGEELPGRGYALDQAREAVEALRRAIAVLEHQPDLFTEAGP